VRRSWIVPFVLFGVTSIAVAQAATDCPDLVSRALEVTNGLCENTRLDQACYGNITISADPVGDPADFNFSKTGDQEDLVKFQELRLGRFGGVRLDENGKEVTEWGVSLMRLKAGLPADSATGVDLVMFGNVNIIEKHDVDNQAQAQANPDITVTMRRTVNVRSLPSTDSSVLTSYPRGSEATVSGRNEAGDWLRVQVGENYGWISRTLTSATDDQLQSLQQVPSNLKPKLTDDTVFGPMQAFYFQSGTKDSPCAQVPDSGILVETPDGVGTIRLRVNEALLDIGSTVYLQAHPDDPTTPQDEGAMTISVLEGLVVVDAGSQQMAVGAGTQTVVPLNKDLVADGPPLPLAAYQAQQYQIMAPVANIEVHPPLTDAEITTFDSRPVPGLWAVTYDGSSLVQCGDTKGGVITFNYPNHQVAVTVQPDGSVQWVSSTNSIGLNSGGTGTYFGAASTTVTAEDGTEAFFNDGYTVNFTSPISATGSIFATVRTSDGLGCKPHTKSFSAHLVSRSEVTG
jgi:uncharacterized protein YraI